MVIVYYTCGSIDKNGRLPIYLMDSMIEIFTGFSYSSLCLQSYPCQHKVIINGKKKRMYGDDIYDMCIDKNLAVPEHFKIYAPVDVIQKPSN
jgi:hypothetical protein